MNKIVLPILKGFVTKVSYRNTMNKRLLDYVPWHSVPALRFTVDTTDMLKAKQFININVEIMSTNFFMTLA